MNIQRLLQKLRVPEADIVPLAYNHDPMARLVDQGVLHPRAFEGHDIGDVPQELQGTMYMPVKPTDSPDDYLTARMGPDAPTHPRSVALHEQDHILQRGNFWEDMPVKLAYRAQNRGINEGLMDDLLRTARSYSLGPNRTKFEELATDMENSMSLQRELDHDMQGKEILADSGARLGKFFADTDPKQRTFDIPFLQEAAVNSTVYDRPLAAIEAMKRRARRGPVTKSIALEQGTLEY